MPCKKEDCECKEKVTKVDVMLPEKTNCGVWLTTEDPECMHIYADENAIYIGYNSPNLKEEEACNTALSFEKDGIARLQYFKNKDKNSITVVTIDKNLAYDVLRKLLFDLREKAIQFEITEKTVK